MADLLGVKRTTYASWETRVVPDVASLIKIGQLLSVDWTTLVKETISGKPFEPSPLIEDPTMQQIKESIETTKQTTEATRAMVEEILKKLNK